MATRSKKAPKKQYYNIPGLFGIRVIVFQNENKLELRHMLGLPRDKFSRLVNVSVRAIAKVESNKEKVEKLQRNYIEVKRLCQALSEVVNPDCLGDWFYTPNEAFQSRKPVEVIEHGEIDRLWDMVYRLSSGIPG
ncbi:MAG TPA: hypothetical protein DCY03_14795 [Planctomycetaceae bacterium]|nr:hypothetical protein [Planctomycetaceae bacterium]